MYDSPAGYFLVYIYYLNIRTFICTEMFIKKWMSKLWRLRRIGQGWRRGRCNDVNLSDDYPSISPLSIGVSLLLFSRKVGIHQSRRDARAEYVTSSRFFRVYVCTYIPGVAFPYKMSRKIQLFLIRGDGTVCNPQWFFYNLTILVLIFEIIFTFVCLL